MSSTITAQIFLNKLQCEKDIQILDVRTPVEHAAQRLCDADHIPLDQLDKPDSLSRLRNTQGQLYLLCKSGKRAEMAKEVLSQHLTAELVTIQGGLDKLVELGCDIDCDKSIWSLERQVRFTAGILIAVGCLLSMFVYPPFIWLSLFVGCGLVFASVTDSCAMGLVLARMPWNRTTS